MTKQNASTNDSWPTEAEATTESNAAAPSAAATPPELAPKKSRDIVYLFRLCPVQAVDSLTIQGMDFNRKVAGADVECPWFLMRDDYRARWLRSYRLESGLNRGPCPFDVVSGEDEVEAAAAAMALDAHYAANGVHETGSTLERGRLDPNHIEANPFFVGVCVNPIDGRKLTETEFTRAREIADSLAKPAGNISFGVDLADHRIHAGLPRSPFGSAS